MIRCCPNCLKQAKVGGSSSCLNCFRRRNRVEPNPPPRPPRPPRPPEPAYVEISNVGLADNPTPVNYRQGVNYLRRNLRNAQVFQYEGEELPLAQEVPLSYLRERVDRNYPIDQLYPSREEPPNMLHTRQRKRPSPRSPISPSISSISSVGDSSISGNSYFSRSPSISSVSSVSDSSISGNSSSTFGQGISFKKRRISMRL